MARSAVTRPTPAEQDARRTKPRLSIVLDPDEREIAETLAASERVSISRLVGNLLRAEADRERRRVSK